MSTITQPPTTIPATCPVWCSGAHGELVRGDEDSSVDHRLLIDLIKPVDMLDTGFEWPLAVDCFVQEWDTGYEGDATPIRVDGWEGYRLPVEQAERLGQALLLAVQTVRGRA